MLFSYKFIENFLGQSLRNAWIDKERFVFLAFEYYLLSRADFYELCQDILLKACCLVAVKFLDVKAELIAFKRSHDEMKQILEAERVLMSFLNWEIAKITLYDFGTTYSEIGIWAITDV